MTQLLNAFSPIVSTFDDIDIISLNKENNVALIRKRKGLTVGQADTLEKSTRFYSMDELQRLMLQDESDEDFDTVWVCVNGENFAKAYNNYYNDARRFRKNLLKALSRTYEKIAKYKRIFIPGYEQLVDGLTYEDIKET